MNERKAVNGHMFFFFDSINCQFLKSNLKFLYMSNFVHKLFHDSPYNLVKLMIFIN